MRENSNVESRGGEGLIKFKEFARRVSLSTRQVYRLIDEKKLPPPLKQGRRNYYRESDLVRYFQQLQSQRA